MRVPTTVIEEAATTDRYEVVRRIGAGGMGVVYEVEDKERGTKVALKTINDPNVWTRPFTLRYPFKLDPEYKVYEYGCHEGNYAMFNALQGARSVEQQGRTTRVVK